MCRRVPSTQVVDLAIAKSEGSRVVRGQAYTGLVGKVSSILIVDDVAGVREFVAGAIELDDFEPMAVASGDAALALLQQRAYDLMFTDLKMPGMGGIELLARAKELQPELEVIVLTAQGSVDTAVEAQFLGPADGLPNEVERAELHGFRTF